MRHTEFVADLRCDWRYRFWEAALWLPLTLESWRLRLALRRRRKSRSCQKRKS